VIIKINNLVMVSLKKLAMDYINNFNNKDLIKLKKMFALDVSLRDWNVYSIGIDSVIEANRSIFIEFKNIKATPLAFIEDSYKIAIELEICLDNSNKIKVLDILEFNEDFKIKSIKAFKG